jgi:N-acetylglutamate synthase/N-acetylornithine aminotransferase
MNGAAQGQFELHINLKLGQASAAGHAADLTEEYADFNKGDAVDLPTLGG